MCCYLYRKRSNTNNLMRKLKSKVEICKLPSMTPVFLPRYREARKLHHSPCWRPSQGIPRKGQALSRVTPWIAPGLPHAQAGLRLSHLWQSLSRTAPRRLHYQAFGRNAAVLVPYGTRWRPHHKRGWCGLARLQAPPMYNNGSRKHRVIRGMQTSLNIRPKPRASA